MAEGKGSERSRREFLAGAGRVAAGSALAMAGIPAVHAAGDSSIQLAIVGCGGRGSGAVLDAMNAKGAPNKFVAMADVFENRLNDSHGGLKGRLGDRMDVPKERQFIGFDAYKKAMDCLKPGDVVILATPPAFRWVHFTYAIEKGLNVFMEKPVAVDGGSAKRMLALAEKAGGKNLKVAVGLMSRHNRAMQELSKRIKDGEIGDIILERGYRVHGFVGSFASEPKPAGISDLLYQIQRFHSFLWASGGNYSDFYVHGIDNLCWMKDAWPINAQALGGRHYKANREGVSYVDQNFDTYAVEYTYADGSKFLYEGRCMENCYGIYSSYVHGTKGIAIVSSGGDCGMPSAIYKGQNTDPSKLVWQSNVPGPEGNPYQNEWNDFMDAIRNNKPYSEVKRGAEASLVTAMGRQAAHSGQLISFDQCLNHEPELGVGLDKLTYQSNAPLMPGSDGRYPIPRPGQTGDNEF